VVVPEVVSINYTFDQEGVKFGLSQSLVGPNTREVMLLLNFALGRRVVVVILFEQSGQSLQRQQLALGTGEEQVLHDLHGPVALDDPTEVEQVGHPFFPLLEKLQHPAIFSFTDASKPAELFLKEVFEAKFKGLLVL